MPTDPLDANEYQSRGRILKWATVGLAIAGAFILLPQVSTRIAQGYSAVSSLPVATGVGVVALINFVSVTLCFPANMGLMVSAGAALGARNAFAALYLSKLLAACFTFLLARSVLYRQAKSQLERLPKLSRVISTAAQQGSWKMVLTLRLSPFPGFLLNYLLSLTGVGFLDYILGTAVGIFPSILNLSLIGGAARDVGVGAAGGHFNWLAVALKIICSLSTLLCMFFVSRSIQKALADAEERAEMSTTQPHDQSEQYLDSL